MKYYETEAHDTPEEWLGEHDVDSEGGPVCVQYRRCPSCHSTAVHPEAIYNAKIDDDECRYVCDDCDLQSEVLKDA